MLLLTIESKDLDIVVEMKNGAELLTKYIHDKFPQQVTSPHQMGAGYPIWQITFKQDIVFNNETYNTHGAVIEFADTMSESFPDASSRQRVTEFSSLQDDIARRDFTTNMLLKDMTTGEIKDLTGVSRSDIEKGILRGHPGVSLDTIFSADPLRMIRICRFQAKYDWTIPYGVLKTIKRNAHRITIVSEERIIEELKKVMVLGKFHKMIKLMKTTGLLQYILPEVQILTGVKQNPKHHLEGSVFKHTLEVLKHAPNTIEEQMAALLHDVGKPQVQKQLDDNITFYGHEDVGAKIAEAICYRLKLDSPTIKKVVSMVKNHMRPLYLSNERNQSSKALRRFIREVGEDLVDSIVDLAEADALGSWPVENYIPELRDRLKTIKTSPIQVHKKPILNGNEIMLTLNIKPGPKLGEIGQYLLNLEDEYADRGVELTKDEAVKNVKEYFKKGW